MKPNKKNSHFSVKQLALDEIHELLKAFHEGCHKTFPIDETLIDEVNLGRFPNDRDLMVSKLSNVIPLFSFWSNSKLNYSQCYTNCMLESMRFVRKGKLNTEIVKKNIQMFAPIQFRAEWLRGIDACKDVKGTSTLFHSNGNETDQYFVYYFY